MEEFDPSSLLKSKKRNHFIIQTISMSEQCDKGQQTEYIMEEMQSIHIEHHARTTINRQQRAMFENEVVSQVAFNSMDDYCRGLEQNKLIKSFQFQLGFKFYTFDKILPLQINKLSGQKTVQKTYLIPSEIFIIISPTFLNGLQFYLEPHPSYKKQRETYADYFPFLQNGVKNIRKKSSQVLQMEPFSTLEQNFLTQFLLKHSQDNELLRQFVYSIFKFNYFVISDISKNAVLLEQIEKEVRLKYFSFYQLYLKGNNQVRKYIISQIIGEKSYIGRYSELYSTPFIQTPFCIKYQGKYVAMVFVRRLKEEQYAKKLKMKSLINELKEKQYREIMYIYTLYVLPMYKGMGHGSHILNVLKLSELPLVLCSSSSRQLSGLSDNVGNNYFYKKCQFQEYFPLQVSQEQDQLDRGCLLQTEQQHNKCHINYCNHPNKVYQDQSYYVHYPNTK